MFRPLITSLLATAICSTGFAQIQCKTSEYGSSCGPTLTATCTPNGNTHRATLTVKKADPDSRLFMMIGVQQTSIPLSWIFLNTESSCNLLLLPIFIQQHNPNAAGHFTYSRAVGSWKGTGHAQFLELQPSGKVLATNGVTITRG